MKLSNQGKSRWLVALCSTAFFLSLGVNQLAQTTQPLPAPTGHVNDFAGVVDENTKQQLENMLANVKLKTDIEFDIATVQSTAGQDIFDFSRQLAKDWNIGARTSPRKSLLLVVSVNEKTSFTQFSKSVQNDLPEGVLGEMGQVMRGLVDDGKFSQGINAGVRHFVGALGRKLALNTDDFDKPVPVNASVSPAPPVMSSNKSIDEAAPAITRSTRSDTDRTTVKPSATRSATGTTKIKTTSTVEDEDESEEVELTLTKPLAERVT
ncbi:MAG TPA: TPM domain-containing protein, partial [Pyrinomonadaceae bacterium]